MKDARTLPAVLIVVENLPVPLDRRVWQEARALRDAGYQPVVICPQMRGYTAAEERLENIQIYRHWISQEGRGVFGFLLEYTSALWGELRLAVKVWRGHRFRVIHLCNPPDLLFLVAWPFKLLGVRVIYDVHDLWPEMFEAKFSGRGWLYRLVRLAERLTYAIADVVIATNDSVRAAALSRGRKSPENIFVVRSAPVVRPADHSPDPGLRKGRKYLVGYLGVMGRQDGVHLLIEAAAELVHARKRSDIQFLLMGSGPEYEALQAQCDRLNLREFVDLPGWALNDFLFRALATIDLGVSPDPPNAYNHHCTMNKVLEYMAFGKAQVLFDLKESRASAGDAALYVRETSPAALARGIAELLDDPARRLAMGQLALERFNSSLSWDRSVPALLAAYRKAAGH